MWSGRYLVSLPQFLIHDMVTTVPRLSEVGTNGRAIRYGSGSANWVSLLLLGRRVPGKQWTVSLMAPSWEVATELMLQWMPQRSQSDPQAGGSPSTKDPRWGAAKHACLESTHSVWPRVQGRILLGPTRTDSDKTQAPWRFYILSQPLLKLTSTLTFWNIHKEYCHHNLGLKNQWCETHQNRHLQVSTWRCRQCKHHQLHTEMLARSLKNCQPFALKTNSPTS
jgi:hypothetical protein